MQIYSLLIFLPAIPCALPYLIRGIDKEKCKRASLLIFFIILFLLSALRAKSVGTDTINYLMIFRRFSGWSFPHVFQYKEPAFAVLCKLLSLVTDNYQWLIVIVALIAIVPVTVLYLQDINYPLTTIALFLNISNFYMFFSGMRQSIAISLGILAFFFVRKKQFIPYLLLAVLAFLFHRSALVLILMYPLYHIRLKRKSLFFVVPVMVLIYVFNKQVFSFLQGIIQDYESVGNKNTGAVTMLILLVLFCVFSFVIPDEKTIDSDTIGLRNFILMATLIQMFAPLNSFAMRIGYYYMIFVPLLIPRVIAKTSLKWRQFSIVAHYVFLVFFIARFLFIAPSSNALDIFPYHFFWEMV